MVIRIINTKRITENCENCGNWVVALARSVLDTLIIFLVIVTATLIYIFI